MTAEPPRSTSASSTCCHAERAKPAMGHASHTCQLGPPPPGRLRFASHGVEQERGKRRAVTVWTGGRREEENPGEVGFSRSGEKVGIGQVVRGIDRLQVGSGHLSKTRRAGVSAEAVAASVGSTSGVSSPTTAWHGQDLVAIISVRGRRQVHPRPS